MAPDGGGWVVFDLFREVRDNKLPTLAVSPLPPNFSVDSDVMSSSVPDNEPHSGSARILSKVGSLSTAGI